MDNDKKTNITEKHLKALEVYRLLEKNLGRPPSGKEVGQCMGKHHTTAMPLLHDLKAAGENIHLYKKGGVRWQSHKKRRPRSDKGVPRKAAAVAEPTTKPVSPLNGSSDKAFSVIRLLGEMTPEARKRTLDAVRNLFG